MSLCTTKVDKTKKSHYIYLKILCPKLSPVTDFMLPTGKNKTLTKNILPSVMEQVVEE